MSFLRSSVSLRSTIIRPAFRATPRAPLSTTSARLASQDYGSGEGNPKGEAPQQQGKNPSENLEHPGPPAPKVGQNASSSPNEGSSSSGGKSQSSTPKSGASSAGQKGGQSGSNDGAKKGAQPKILNENPPAENDPSVKQHNEEMDQRAEKAHEQVSNKDAGKDKVGKGFWSGQGGRDQEP